MGEIAITYTIRNEANLVLQNINFHKKLGVEFFFIFLDNNTDNTPDLLGDIPGVFARKSLKPEELKDKFLEDRFLSKTVNHDARRVFNTTWAAQEAKKLGCKWIISIDADELILCDFNNLEEAKIKSKLRLIDSKVNQVIFKTYEQVPRFIDKSERFSKESEFFTRSQANNTRSIYDPFSKQELQLGRSFIGHDAGKTAFRLSALDSSYPLPHKWLNRRDGTIVEAITIDALLHFYFYDFQYFRRRFSNYQNRSEKSITGYQYPEHILLLIKICKELSDEEFKEYYKKHICFQYSPEGDFIRLGILRDLL